MNDNTGISAFVAANGTRAFTTALLPVGIPLSDSFLVSLMFQYASGELSFLTCSMLGDKRWLSVNMSADVFAYLNGTPVSLTHSYSHYKAARAVVVDVSQEPKQGIPANRWDLTFLEYKNGDLGRPKSLHIYSEPAYP